MKFVIVGLLTREQRVILRRKLAELKQYGCLKKEERKIVYPKEREVQQSNVQIGALEGIAKKGKEIRRTFKMLREVWLNIRVKKIDMHKGITVKALLDSSTIGMFMDRKMAA